MQVLCDQFIVFAPAGKRPILRLPNSSGTKCYSYNFCFLTYEIYQYWNALFNIRLLLLDKPAISRQQDNAASYSSEKQTNITTNIQ